jgi:hypothetical protein
MTRYAVAILLALTMPAGAQDINSANHILPGCKGILDRESTPTWGQGQCAGFIDGLVYRGSMRENCVKNRKVWAFPSRYNALTLQEGGSHDGRYVAPRFGCVQPTL